MNAPINKVRERLAKVRGSSTKFMACCPAHEDKNPSLSVKESEHGDVLLNCFAGCKPQAVVAAIGMEMRDLYNMPIPKANGNGSHFRTDTERTEFFQSVSIANLPSVKARLPNSAQIEGMLKESEARRAEGLAIRKMSDVKAEAIRWLWFPFIPLAMLTLIDGMEGIGKTFLMLALAAAYSLGRGLFGVSPEDHPEAGNVLLLMPEDIASVIKSRLEQMGADMDRIFIIEEAFPFDERGILRLSNAIQTSDAGLVFIDPVFAYAGRIDINQDNQIRTVTGELKRLADVYQCAIVGSRHLNKSKGMGDPRNAGLAGVAWRAAARSALLIGQNPENERERAIVQTKTNLTAESSQSIGFVIDHDGFHWTGKSHLTASTMLSIKPQETYTERSQREEAREFLKDILRSRPMAPKDIFKAGNEVGLSESTINRAKHDLGIKPRKVGLGPWEWTLP